MERELFPKNIRVYLPLVAIFVALVLLLPREGQFRYHYQKGRPWMYETLISPIDFPILKTNQELMAEREEKSSFIIPFYKVDETVSRDIIQGLYSLNIPDSRITPEQLVSIFEQIYSVGLVSEFTEAGGGSDIVIVQKDKRASEVPAGQLFEMARARTFLKLHLAEYLGDAGADSLYDSMSLSSFLVPNLKFDQNTTDMMHKEAASYISPTKGVVYTGQLIVSEGEIVTSEIEQLLDSYKAEYLANIGFSDSNLWVISGSALLLLASVFILFLTILFVDKSIFSDMRRYYFILTLYVLCVLVTELLSGGRNEFLYLVPYPLFALYMMAFIRKEHIFPIYVSILLPVLIVSAEGTEVFLMNLIAGFVAILAFTRFNRGWLQFVGALFIFLALLVTYLAFTMIRNGEISEYRNYWSILNFALASLFCVAGYPLVFLFEKIFMLVSNQKLRDLADTNNPILREFAEKAPGTFQHALQVMNLADACARSIGANVRLVRTGALYHDIGKISNPQCFIENAAPGVNYHSGLTPAESARDIIKHVDDGMLLAKKHKVPEEVSDFILSHHGTSRTEYFYNVYVNSGGDPADTAMFEYHGFKPRTKEQVVVMLADTVEAASRSLKDYSEKSISDLVERLVKMKMDDGQFSDADITIKEIGQVKATLVNYLKQINHARIAYPKREQKQ